MIYAANPAGVLPMVIGTALRVMTMTLFVVPALYVAIARNTRSPQHVSRLIEKLGYSAHGEPVSTGH